MTKKKNWKRLGVLLLFLALVLAAPVLAAGENVGFSDVPSGAGYAPAVEWCVEEGLMNGISATAFSPEATLTRAMVVTVLHRAAGEPKVAWSEVFSDVPAGQWYSEAVSWADDSGIVKGYGNGLFGTDDPITREQLDVIIRRYKGEAPALESYDLNGKTVVLFCTSGSSGIGSSVENLHGLADGAVWLDGRRFSGSASESAVTNWVNGRGLELSPNRRWTWRDFPITIETIN